MTTLPHNGSDYRRPLALRNGEPMPLDAIDKLESEAQDYANTGNGFGTFLMLVACLCGLGLAVWLWL